MLVIQQFFDDYHLIEVRKHIHRLLEVAVISSNDMYAVASERDAIVCFCDRVEKLVEVVFLSIANRIKSDLLENSLPFWRHLKR